MEATAVATRAQGWWAVRVPEVDGAFTQARRLDQVSRMAADAVALLVGVDAADVVVDVRVEVAKDISDEVAAARAESDAAAKAQVAAAAHQRSVARKLRESGLTGRDASAVLRVSPQRYSQLLHD